VPLLGKILRDNFLSSIGARVYILKTWGYNTKKVNNGWMNFLGSFGYLTKGTEKGQNSGEFRKDAEGARQCHAVQSLRQKDRVDYCKYWLKAYDSKLEA